MKKYAGLLIFFLLLAGFSNAIAAKKPQKSQNIIQRDAFGYPIQTVSFSTIRQLLANRQYQKLNTLLDGYQKEFEKDFRNEYKVYDAYYTFSAPIPGYQSLFDEWVKKYPNAYQSHLARAFYLEEMGWECRGYKWAKDTKQQQFEYMERYFKVAKQELEYVFHLEPKAIAGYSILIGMNMAMSNDSENQKLIAKSLELFPNSFMIRSFYMKALEPRWGGSYTEMDEFAEEAQAYVSTNPKLKLLKGYALADRGDRALSDKDYAKAFSLYKNALSFGDYWDFYYGQAESYYYGNLAADALPLINKAIAFDPQNERCYTLRAEICYKLGYYDQSIKDVQTAENILPGYSETKETRQWITECLVSDGYELYQSKRYDQAVKLYSWAVMMNPNYAEAYYWRGITYCDQNQLKLAYNDFNQAISINSRYFDAYYSMDWVLCHDRQWDKIISYWNRYISLEPNDGRAYRERGGTYYHKGDLKAALADAKRAGELGDAEGQRQYERLKSMVK